MFFRCQMKGIYLQAPGAYVGAQWSRAAKMTSHRNIDQHKVPNSTETKRFITRRSKPKVQICHSFTAKPCQVVPDSIATRADSPCLQPT